MDNNQVSVNAVLVNAQMTALTNQRNAAQNENVQLAGQLAVMQDDKLRLQAQIDALTVTVTELTEKVAALKTPDVIEPPLETLVVEPDNTEPTTWPHEEPLIGVSE